MRHVAQSRCPAQNDIHQQVLLAEHYLVAVRRDHLAVEGFNLDLWLEFPHILVSGKGETRSPLDNELALIMFARRIGLVVPSFGMAPTLLRRSDMVAMLPSRILADAGDLVSRLVPIKVQGFSLHLWWHRRRTSDLGLRHVADLLAALLE